MDLAFSSGSNIENPTHHIGIMDGERQNWKQNKLQLNKSAHHLDTALIDIEFAECILNYDTFKFHTEEFEKPIHMRFYPQYKVCKELNEEIFSNLQNIYNGMFSLRLLQDEFHNCNDKQINPTYTLIPCADQIEGIVSQIVYTKIVNNNIKIGKDGEWNENLTYALYALINKYDIKEINEKNLECLSKEFKKCGLKEFASKQFLTKKLKELENVFVNVSITHSM